MVAITLHSLITLNLAAQQLTILGTEMQMKTAKATIEVSVATLQPYAYG